MCSQHAKVVTSGGVDEVEALLKSGRPVAACLAPSFPAEFDDRSAETLVGMLRQAGFAVVAEVAFGADQSASRSFEFRYVSSNPAANGETDFKGPTEVFTTEERVSFLKHYTDYGRQFFGVPGLDQVPVKDDEVTRALKGLKEQPLPMVRKRIPLTDWRWLGWREGENEARRAAIESWGGQPGVKVSEGVLRFTGEAPVVREIPEQSWRFALQCDLRAPAESASWNLQLCDVDAVVAAVGLNSGGQASYTSAGRKVAAGRLAPGTWHSVKLEVDCTSHSYNVYLDNRRVADFVPLEAATARRVNRLRLEGTAGVAIENLWGVGYGPTPAKKAYDRSLYTIKTFLDEDFQLKPDRSC